MYDVFYLPQHVQLSAVNTWPWLLVHVLLPMQLRIERSHLSMQTHILNITINKPLSELINLSIIYDH